MGNMKGLSNDYLNRKVEEANINSLKFFIPFLTIAGFILLFSDPFLYNFFRVPNSIILHLAHWSLFLPHFFMLFFLFV